ncbi:MAG: alpha/beta fold hydrolase [Myxococcales bacterium]|nr:alpha/beta fold hydrolase [Myxococcales bacterium]
MIEHVVDVRGARIFVREAGTGPTVMLGHALTFDGEMWAAQFDAFSRRYRVLAADFPGHGRSDDPPGPYSLDGLADRIAGVMDALGVRRAAYCGLSMGGMVGLRLALRRPERVAALALLNTSASEEDPGKRPFLEEINERSRGKPANEATVAFLMQLMFSDGFRAREPLTVRRFHDKVFHSTRDGEYWCARAVLGRDSVEDALGRIAVPTVVLTSDADVAVPPAHSETLATRIPGAKFHVLRGVGHMTAVEAAEEVNAILGAWLDAYRCGETR